MTMKNKKIIVSICLSWIITAVSVILFLSCGARQEPVGSNPGNGRIALFITDNISFYKQVVATITNVRLINSGTQTTCEVLSAPVTLDIANLSGIAQFTNVSDCSAGQYNRIDIEFRKNVRLMNQLDAVSACRFDSYFDDQGAQLPLGCDPVTDLCAISIRGALREGSVQVLEDRYNHLGIDFDLKQFTVADFGAPACSVTMKLSSVDASRMSSSGRSYSVTGIIANLNATAKTFSLIRGDATLTVDYSGILPSVQPDIDTLLNTARTKGFSVNILTGSIDLTTNAISASRISVKAAGVVSAVMNQPDWTFYLTHDPAMPPLSISFGPPAVIAGTLADGAWVDLNLQGYDDDGKAAAYRAAAVEVLPSGTVLED